MATYVPVARCCARQPIGLKPPADVRFLLFPATLSSYNAGECRAGSNEDCKASAQCRSASRCTAVDGECKASNEDCKASQGCKDAGSCSAINGECKAGSNDDCKDSRKCKEPGACTELKGVCR